MFKDEIKEILLPQIEIPKLKGHTKIELTDVHTGKKEVVEHDNAFTTGLQSYFRDLGIARNNPFNKSDYTLNRNLWKTVLGGIYLFDTALPTNAKYMPAGTSMVANGSYDVANAGNPTELGSYNSIESHSDDNGITMVFDWNTSQGNGNIAAVSLGTLDGGYIGYGNATSKTGASNKISVIRTQPDTQLICYVNTWSNMVFQPLYYDEKIYATTTPFISSGTASIKVKFQSFPLKKVDIFKKITNDSQLNWDGEITFTMPSALSEEYAVQSCEAAYPSCILIAPSNGVANGATKPFYLLDVSDGTVTTLSIQNTTGAAFNSSTGTYICFLDDTYALVQTGNASGAIYKINYTNGLVIGEATKNGFSYSYRNGAYYESAGKFTDGLYRFFASGSYLYDSVKNEFLPTNGYITGGSNSESKDYIYNDDLDALCIKSGRYNSSYWFKLAAYKNPLRLMTINNLDTPVEKTAAKTMKVTYTITRATT